MKAFEDYNEKDWHKVTAEGKYILFFYADWCPDCKFIEPKLPELEKEYSDFDWIGFNRDNNMEIAQELGIMGIPSFVVIENGKEIGRLVNKDRKTKEEVETFINSVINK
ncbi:thioredoxin family protein [Companilactobacillus futsaii]|uniref:Thioredoxin family protein n=2 Tax=Companilactobacillus futsaii TaxID=938155 RepID=A0A5B7T1N5_9LACO|nr:thioredoxin family protein [Companilactobacillus futsaii]KRK90857.1 thioredoxin [Companilactobacillus futsaii JCM 17355]QCX24409.1 thioredoxin family protein [Companilactobacillus futsaii]